MLNAAVKSNRQYTLKIVHDEDAQSPLEDDNLGKMICWHRRYELGDKHNFTEPLDFLRDLVRESAKPEDIISYIKNGRSDDLTLEHDPAEDVWRLQSYSDYFKKWYEEYVAESPLDMNDEDLSDAIIDNMGHNDLQSLAEKNNLIMPLYLYDHSILSISTGTFLGRAQHAEWDSGQVGWAYASHADIAKEYGSASPENIARAEKLIKAEVETYDCYLRGECYGFQLFENGVETDSCWGFLGSFDEAMKSIREYLPEDAVPLADSASYGDDEPEQDEEQEEMEV